MRRTPRRASLTQPQQPTFNWRRPALGAVMIVLAMVAVGGPSFFLYHQYHAYRVSVRKEKFEKDAMGKAPTVPVDEIFSDDAMAQYEEGKGLTVEFVTRFRGQEHTEKFILEPWHRFEETTVGQSGERTEYVAKRRQEFLKYVSRFESTQPLTQTIALFVDDTDGVSERYQAEVKEVINDLKLGPWISAGNGLNFFVYRVSTLAAADKKKKVIDIGAKAGANEINELVDWATQNQGPKPHSSIATSIFDVAGELVDGAVHLVVFSDGLENSDMVSLYKNPELLDETNWPELDQKLTQFRQFPNLHGAAVDWYIPVTARSNNQLLRASEKYWKRVLIQKCGAGQVQTHLVKV